MEAAIDGRLRETRGASSDSPRPEAARKERDLASEQRLGALVRDHLEFTWRSLRRLGLPAPLADDATQRVFLILNDRLADIKVGSERAFLFKTAMHVASSEKRSFARRREVFSGEAASELADDAPGADEQLDRHRARATLEEVLQGMEMDLRAVFVLYELEDLSTAEIASALEIPMGTVSSRLRRARDDFRAAAARYQARSRTAGGGRP